MSFSNSNSNSPDSSSNSSILISPPPLPPSNSNSHFHSSFNLTDFLLQFDLLSFNILSYLTYFDLLSILYLNKTSTLLLKQKYLNYFLFISFFLKTLPSLTFSIPSYLSLSNYWYDYSLKLSYYYKKLNKMDSPGCEYQKYLRSFIRLKSSSNLVYNVIQGVAFLPENIQLCFNSLKNQHFTPELQGAWLIMNYSEFDNSYLQGLIQSNQVILLFNEAYIQRYFRLLSWIVSSQDHLRIIMAQYNQLAIRSFQSGNRHPRCVEALIDLIRMRNGEFEKVTLWA